jgi:hypothetical protein
MFTTRQLELTSDGYRRLAEAVGARQAITTAQVHRADVLIVRRDSPPAAERPEADALASNDPAAAIVVRAADCVPLLMADRIRGVVAAVHAGWRGTASRVALAALDALAREFGSRPADLVVAVGPSIGPCCYAVGSELVDAFAAARHERHLIDRWFSAPPAPRGTLAAAPRPLRLDIAGANRDQLVRAGVPEERIHIAGLCTAMHLDVLTSFRAEKERAARIAAAIRAAGSAPPP